MSSFEVSAVDLERLMQNSTPDEDDVRRDAEARLGVALWEVVELERNDETPQQVSVLEWFDALASREAPLAPRASAQVLFKAPRECAGLEKSEWLLQSYEADVQINVFERELPHDDDELSRSTVTLTPHVYGLANGWRSYREAPYVLTTEAPERRQLAVPEIETTIAILGQIAAEYAK